jgi:hypothetical protein
MAVPILAESQNWDWDAALFAASAMMTNMAPLLKAANGGVVPPAVASANDYMTRTLSAWQDRSKKCPTGSPLGDGHWGLCYTAGGMAFLTKWGTLRHASNAAFAATMHAATLDAAGAKASARQHRCWARSQLLYAAGNNPAKQSYIVGYTPAGLKAADRPHHRSSSCDPNYGVQCTYQQLDAPVSPDCHV